MGELLRNSSQNFVARESFQMAAFVDVLTVDYYRHVGGNFAANAAILKTHSSSSIANTSVYKSNSLNDTMASRIKIFINELSKSMENKNCYFVHCFDPNDSQSQTGELVIVQNDCQLNKFSKRDSMCLTTHQFHFVTARQKIIQKLLAVLCQEFY